MTTPTPFSDELPGELSGPRSGATAATVPAEAPRGPHAPTLAVSVIGLLVAGLVAVVDLWHPRLDPTTALPWALLVAGLALVACAVPGLVARRRQRASNG